jgi:hypothetical protein
MGNASSKAAAKTASKLSVTNTARKYPTRSPPTSNTTNTQPARPSPNAAIGPRVHPETKATSTRDGGKSTSFASTSRENPEANIYDNSKI